MKHNIEFVSYDGEYPNLCRGILILKIDGKEISFGYDYKNQKKCDYPEFWSSGGNCGFSSDWSESYVESGPWEISYWHEFPEELKDCADEILEVFNANVPYGCCGGCI